MVWEFGTASSNGSFFGTNVALPAQPQSDVSTS